jgi:vitamin B12 transporter
MSLMRVFYEEEEIVVVSPTRYEKSIPQVAENITIVTARDIEEMNAHTITDVLENLTGLQVERKGGPGIGGFFRIQGSDYRHVLVLIDGVVQNNLSDGVADIGAIPVHNIRKIEIIKGPASSAWGSSLGGVVNIITKPAGNTLKPDISLSSAYGEKDTADIRADIAGKLGRAGYYVYAGKLQSEGFSPSTSNSIYNVYSKLNMDLGEKKNIVITSGYTDGTRGFGEFPDEDLSIDNDFIYKYAALSMNASLTDRAEFSVSLKTSHRDANISFNQLSSGDVIAESVFSDETNGGSAKFTWRNNTHAIVVGSDYDESTLKLNTITGGEQSLRKWGVFSNDTIQIDGLFITPGIRYEHTDTSGDFLSPSLGVTRTLRKNTFLRFSVARGFNIPPLSFTYGGGFFSVPNPDLKVENVWSYQAGIESVALKHLWVKGTVFLHNVRDAIVDEQLPDGTFRKINEDRLRKQGVEMEAKTIPLYNMSLIGGFLFQDTKNLTTDETEKNIPEYAIDIALEYDDKKSLRCSLSGHYIWWNAESSLDAEYSSMIWDFNISRHLKKSAGLEAEAFLTAHNLFNGSQYLDNSFKNPRRWVEAGVSITFY